MFFWHKHDNKTLLLCVGTPAEKEKLNVIQELNVAGGKYIHFFYILYLTKNLLIRGLLQLTTESEEASK